ncbi:hypothetical protein GOODEAATRI_016700 [Goodea atripinnis]|uniref:Uncharacterized protein n=1 Tax=Goodea atripinnis TaxID=208336 RepID=A0ABV0MSN9_9TELE
MGLTASPEELAKSPPLRPKDHLIQQTRRQKAARDQVLEFSRDAQSCDIKASWLKSSERRLVRGAVERRVQAELQQHEADICERRHRLRQLLEAEEKQLLQELEEMKETTVERLAKMRERAKVLKEKRESERIRLVSEKLDQLFR